MGGLGKRVFVLRPAGYDPHGGCELIRMSWQPVSAAGAWLQLPHTPSQVHLRRHNHLTGVWPAGY